MPALRSTPPSADVDELLAAAEDIGFPVFVKAVAGGGGRGMRRVDDPRELREAVERGDARGRGRVRRPDGLPRAGGGRPAAHRGAGPRRRAQGNVLHLFERDCSVQRRHQKVIEIAPAPNLDPELRDGLCADAVRSPGTIGYVNAGTVEFLRRHRGTRRQHVFIEMNPRIQVEHTVTEEITDVDLVQAQLRIAAGETLADLGSAQDEIRMRGAALQCRITTEDPANGFRPDTGMITAYRSPGGAGVRLDGGTAYAGAEISAHFDSMLVKLTCRGRTSQTAVAPGAAGAGRVPDPRRGHEHPVPAGRARRPRLPSPAASRRRSSTSGPSC